MILPFWPIYLAARITTWLTQRAEAAVMREAVWANAVAAERTAVR